MSTFKQFQPKRLPTSAPVAPTSSLLRPSRPLAPVSASVPEPATPVTQAELERAARLGHSFARISLFPPASQDTSEQKADQVPAIDPESQIAPISASTPSAQLSPEARPTEEYTNSGHTPSFGHSFANIPLFPAVQRKAVLPSPLQEGNQLFKRLQVKVGNEGSKDPVIQRFRIGKIPTNTFRQNKVAAEASYTTLATNSAEHHDVADFTSPMRNAILTANDTHFNMAGGVIANPLPPPGQNYASDESKIQLWRQQQLTGQIVNIDHIIPYDVWGANDYRNGRVVSAAENLGAISRTNNFQVISLDNKTVAGQAFSRQEVLGIASLRLLLDAAEQASRGKLTLQAPDHYGKKEDKLTKVTDMTKDDFAAIYNNLPQE